jgi:hypothetical protein
MEKSNDNPHAVSEWLAEIGSHDILNHADMSKDFIEATGEQPCWTAHTVADTRKAIERRGLGGSCAGPDDDKVAYGYEVAESLARKFGRGFSSDKMGRGSIFRDCIEAIVATESERA